jgi:hypothetical protein
MTVETGTDPQQSVTGLTTYVAVVRQRMMQRINADCLQEAIAKMTTDLLMDEP